ncbi:hypothetical protein ABT56_16230 [Photobacterium aquae]|uniref:Retropepsin-like aspartic endopeptidase domain-containing protein n=1 Tax=Photobacterium aquae TaxID=1195763 RepID=A0A0J1GWQ7_9GAMM|nr:RimK/LysX family protein [Photobacterium aquae]KLV04153.1 hypothetical protein ABT56_16230 [Photobacterium aquae]
MRITLLLAGVVLLGGCAQQSAQKTDSLPDVNEPVQPEVVVKQPPVDPPAVEPVPELKPEPKPEPKSEAKPKPQPIVTKTQDGKLILGREEWVVLASTKKPVKATVDNSRSLSSIGVADVQPFERDGKDWVKFKAAGQNLELPVERWSKEKGSDERQPVVKLRARLGDLNELTEFALTAGKGIVLGVNFIRDVAVFDSNRRYVQPKIK